MIYRFLVLMTTYNGEKFVEEQIKSIFNQKKCLADIIVSDDGSTDNTLLLLQKLKQKYKKKIKIKIIKNNNQKNSFSLNFYNLFLLANVEEYDYVALSDQDDTFNHNKFFKAAKFLEKGYYKGFSSSVRCFGESNKILTQSLKITKLDFLFEGAGQGCTFVMNKNSFIEFQDFIKCNYKMIENFIFHDWLVYLFFRSNNYRWKFFNEPLVNYRIHSSNSFGNKYSVNGILKRFSKLLNGWYYNQVMLANSLSRVINPKLPNLHEMKLVPFVFILIKYGRRKRLERIISCISLASIKFIKSLRTK
jgi:rhamnosyltransferase